MRLLLCGGATAGHIFPIIATATTLKHRIPNLASLAIGSGSDLDRQLFTEASLDFVATTAAPIVGTNYQLPWNILKTILATTKANQVVRRFRPHVALSGGGYASIPASIACKLQGIPLVLQTNDIDPGQAARFIARFAKVITIVCHPAAAGFCGRQTVVTGLPLRGEFRQANAERARTRFAIPEGKPLLVVMGGSQGAKAINEALGAILSPILQMAYVVHLTGSQGIKYAQSIRQDLPTDMRQYYLPVRFLEAGISDLFLAADLVISRAGGSIHEFTASGLPSLLIPGTYAGAHQRSNALWLQNAGAALVLEEGILSPETLLAQTSNLLNNPPLLTRMANAATFLGRPDAADHVAEILTNISIRKAA